MILRLFALALYLLAGAAAACAPPPGEMPADVAASLVVVEPQLEKIPRDDGNALATLVSLKNTAASCVDEVMLQVRYFDADRKLIDSATEVFSDSVVPPGKTVAYRLDRRPLRPLADYAAQEVTVVSAQPLYRRGPAPPRTFFDTVYDWIPFAIYMVLLLTFLMFLIRGKKSPQNRALALAERQAQLQEQQIRQLQRIADALDARAARATDAS